MSQRGPRRRQESRVRPARRRDYRSKQRLTSLGLVPLLGFATGIFGIVGSTLWFLRMATAGGAWRGTAAEVYVGLVLLLGMVFGSLGLMLLSAIAAAANGRRS